MENDPLNFEQKHLDSVIKRISHIVQRLHDKYKDDQNKVETSENINNKIQSLKDIASKPYFVRLDFLEDGEKKPETIYIGKQTVIDKNDFLVYDWRAPISSIYYSGDLGETYYKTPIGKQKVDVKLKRQFEINDQKIINMYDAGDTIGDQLLLATLSQSSSHKMNNIVATIQSEQNKVIRNDTDAVLSVQGIAGSGKTAVLLQRVAWLLYQYRSTVNSKQILILSPNELFSNYINNVLPDLGEPNALQLTFNKLFKMSAWVRDYHIEDLAEQVTSPNSNVFFKKQQMF
ncbi:UvrD-helicase domain-containing protein [Secundilactobacillus collinoides]|uniref:UvrD-helicase domain-containing protein n=1 Tax=Secundilactobacillus collinoides TaxID=33960 RepID=UPI000A99F406|nr:UvrD-helicase domain-containing protein [Secundilactobacillus collinoides]